MRGATRRLVWACAITLSSLIFWSGDVAAEFSVRYNEYGQVLDRFDRSRGAIYQLERYAALVGVERHEISDALWDGRFAPHPEDLELALAEIAYDEMESLGLSVQRNDPLWWNQFNSHALARAFPSIDASDWIALDREMRRRIYRAWDARYGPVPSALALEVAQQEERDPASVPEYAELVASVHTSATLATDGYGAPNWLKERYIRIREEQFFPSLAMTAELGPPPGPLIDNDVLARLRMVEQEKYAKATADDFARDPIPFMNTNLHKRFTRAPFTDYCAAALILNETAPEKLLPKEKQEGNIPLFAIQIQVDLVKRLYKKNVDLYILDEKLGKGDDVAVSLPLALHTSLDGVCREHGAMLEEILKGRDAR